VIILSPTLVQMAASLERDKAMSLGDKMIMLANNMPAGEDQETMLRLARQFNVAVGKIMDGSGSVDDTSASLLGAWARARRHWCKLTGIPLI
jgi:hypothetical protein